MASNVFFKEVAGRSKLKLKSNSMRTAIFSILFFCTITCFSQNTLPPVYEIKADTPVSKVPDAYWQMLTDTSGRLTINDIQSPQISSQFHSIPHR